MKYIFEAIFAVAILLIADLQAQIIEKNKPINHTVWGLVFVTLGGIGLWFQFSWWFAAALVIEHFIFFAPLLNFLRHPRKPFFYISSQPKTGSIWDKWLIKIESIYPYLYIIAVIGFILIQWKL